MGQLNMRLCGWEVGCYRVGGLWWAMVRRVHVVVCLWLIPPRPWIMVSGGGIGFQDVWFVMGESLKPARLLVHGPQGLSALCQEGYTMGLSAARTFHPAVIWCADTGPRLGSVSGRTWQPPNSPAIVPSPV
jgi:hypothetical protein